MSGWCRELVDFWFALDPQQWWKADAALDADLRRRFLPVWEEQRGKLPEAFLGCPEEALAACLLFDQLPRNMFRGHADQFSTDPLARAISRGAVERGHDQTLPPERRAFLYMPLEHSEDMADQRRSLLLFTELGDAELLRYARLHHDVIDRFGRFPHRNALLGRRPREDEIEAGEVVPW